MERITIRDTTMPFECTLDTVASLDPATLSAGADVVSAVSNESAAELEELKAQFDQPWESTVESATDSIDTQWGPKTYQ